MSVHKDAKRITTQVVHEMKQSGEKIAMLTAYEIPLRLVGSEMCIRDRVTEPRMNFTFRRLV